MDRVAYVKGHGTQNDFVLLPDPDGVLDLTPRRVRALCDRRRGLGADGVLRVVRTAAGWDGGAPVPAAEWFMDYRNADGSLAEMCGNGARVFGRYLVAAGLVAASEVVELATRGGVRRLWTEADGEVSVDMGPARLGSRSVARLAGVSFPGVAVDVGNPHLVCVTDEPVDGLDLGRAPEVHAGHFPHGVNVELVNRIDATTARMRVHERGVGETRSCGTGAVAVAAALLDGRHGEVAVDVPGGRVRVNLRGGGATLTGPAQLVAVGELEPDWWSGADRQ